MRYSNILPFCDGRLFISHFSKCNCNWSFFHLVKTLLDIAVSTLSFRMWQNGHTYFKNLVLFTHQDVQSMFDHFSTLLVKGLNNLKIIFYLLCRISANIYDGVPCDKNLTASSSNLRSISIISKPIAKPRMSWWEKWNYPNGWKESFAKCFWTFIFLWGKLFNVYSTNFTNSAAIYSRDTTW